MKKIAFTVEMPESVADNAGCLWLSQSHVAMASIEQGFNSFALRRPIKKRQALDNVARQAVSEPIDDMLNQSI